MSKMTVDGPPSTQANPPSQERPTFAPQPVRRPLAPWWRGISFEGKVTVVGMSILAVLVIVVMIVTVTGAGARTATGGANTGSSAAGGATQPKVPDAKPPAHNRYNPSMPPVQQGSTVNVKLVAKDALVAITPEKAYRAWTFNGTLPGPIIHVRQGQTVNFTLTNGGTIGHSMDFHAAQTPPEVNYKTIMPGKSISYQWKANYPGVFMYHCGTPPVMDHIANGMYGAIVVDPVQGWSPAREYVLVQSELYVKQSADGTYALDQAAALAGKPSYVVFNGYFNQYQKDSLTAKPGEKIRLYILNAGPTTFSAFHVIGTIFSDVYADGNPANRTVGQQTVTIPPGGGAVVELTIPEAGTYPLLTHSFMSASMGAIGTLKVQP